MTLTAKRHGEKRTIAVFDLLLDDDTHGPGQAPSIPPIALISEQTINSIHQDTTLFIAVLNLIRPLPHRVPDHDVLDGT